MKSTDAAGTPLGTLHHRRWRALGGVVAAIAIAAPARGSASPDEQCGAMESEAAQSACLGRSLPQLGNGSEMYPMESRSKGSLLGRRWELDSDAKMGTFNIRAYKPVFLLPVFWSTHANQAPHSPNPNNTVPSPVPIEALEAKFQLSFKTKAWENIFGDNGDLWLGYTQTSHWQVYNTDTSRPFRETNYEPEALITFRSNYRVGDWTGRLAAIGINHQSNGRAAPLSRSWNRVVGMIGLDRENWALTLRPWWRVKERAMADDNADIEDFVGRGDATVVYLHGGHQFAVMGRHSLRGGDRSRGALQFTWAFPIHGNLRGHLAIFDGYGESLVDYNHRATYVGLGISLLEWY
jgi:phospholipase A1